MKARLLKSATAAELLSEIESNLDLYRKGDFNSLTSDTRQFIEVDLEIDEQKLSSITCSKNDLREVENCRAMIDAMKNLTPYLARDSRLWTYLTHTELLAYSRERWPIPSKDEEAIPHIKNHFFAVDARGFERNNAASRLWWIAYLCGRADGLTLDEALKCLLYRADVRAAILERPTTSQSVPVFSEILKTFNESYKKDKSLFDRKQYRPWMKHINLRGGVTLLSALDKNSIASIINQYI